MIFGLVDWVIIVVVLFSTIISLWRGATREIISLLTWVLAAWLAFHYYAMFSLLLEPYIEAPELRAAASFGIIVLLVLIVGTFVGRAITKAINYIGLSGIDKIMGMAFGCARGVLILAIVVLLVSYTELPSEPWWQNSLLIPYLVQVADYMSNWLSQHGFEPFQVGTSSDIILPHSEG